MWGILRGVSEDRGALIISPVPDPGKGVCAGPVNGAGHIGEGGAGSPRREQGASVEPRQGRREDVRRRQEAKDDDSSMAS